MSRHVRNHLGPGLDHLPAAFKGAVVGPEHDGMGVLHVSTQRIAAQQGFAAENTGFDETFPCLGAIDHGARDVVEVGLLGFLKSLRDGYETVEAFPLLGLD